MPQYYRHDLILNVPIEKRPYGRYPSWMGSQMMIGPCGAIIDTRWYLKSPGDPISRKLPVYSLTWPEFEHGIQSFYRKFQHEKSHYTQKELPLLRQTNDALNELRQYFTPWNPEVFATWDKAKILATFVPILERLFCTTNLKKQEMHRRILRMMLQNGLDSLHRPNPGATLALISGIIHQSKLRSDEVDTIMIFERAKELIADLEWQRLDFHYSILETKIGTLYRTTSGIDHHSPTVSSQCRREAAQIPPLLIAAQALDIKPYYDVGKELQRHLFQAEVALKRQRLGVAKNALHWCNGYLRLPPREFILIKDEISQIAERSARSLSTDDKNSLELTRNFALAQPTLPWSYLGDAVAKSLNLAMRRFKDKDPIRAQQSLQQAMQRLQFFHPIAT